MTTNNDKQLGKVALIPEKGQWFLINNIGARIELSGRDD